MLDRTANISPATAETDLGETPRVARRRLRRAAEFLRARWRFLVAQSSSSLTRRIVLLNVAGLLVLVISILYLSQYRAGLIDARVQSLLVQGEIIASAIASSATVETDTITIDPDKLLELQTGESYGPQDEALSGLEFPINLERVAPVLRRLVQPTRTQARIYDREGALQIDSRNLYGRGDVLRFDLVPADDRPTRMERAWIAVKNWFSRGDLPLYRDLGPGNGRGYPEVVQALAGQKASTVRANERGEIIVLVAVPIQRFRAVRGALLLSTQGGEIDDAVAAERLQVVTLFLALGAVMVLLSMLLARTIAGPVRRLAEAAETVRRRIKSRGEIPDFTYRRDEIGELSGALREMTNSLYSRIEAIESFAADVAHELKNPLTSLRSAVETMPLAKTPESRARLLAVIEHDVRRLDRLISDVSDASRLDAELQRHDVAPVDLTRLLKTVVTVANEVRRDDGVTITLAFEGGAPRTFMVRGHDSRLGQVIDNLIENARSFSPQGGSVRITAKRLRSAVEITVDDDGPGIQPEAMERIFERFYTDRPHQGFGQNSGLGLSISRQIVEAHGGRIRAENRIGVSEEPDGPRVLGARFVVRLPAM
ncbi:MAG: two-component system, OmpR family, sensor histidine kinase ChvG [Hyphomicrobiales bacterium]|nr:two-component system, OmpR family, sensor histidine kinase ChvG [Hyphomicrobiales bacterium]